jgi:class 3 adenylate cyclase
MEQDETSELIRKIEKETLLLRRKLDRSEAQRGQVEQLMDQTLVLLKRVTEERLTEEERKRLEVFRKFVPAEFLISLGKERFEDIELGDNVEREMSVLFSDIRGFTARSERLTPKETFHFINDYLDQLEPSIHQYNGFIDKIIGDAIMALFYSIDDAVKAAIGMRKALYQYNIELRQENIEPIETGIGIHTGICMLGIIGGKERMEGTVISDAVNLAARLESLTKRYKSALLISESSLSKVTGSENYKTRFLGKVQLAGKSKPVMVLEILNAEENEIRDKKWKSKGYLEAGLQLFFNKQFQEASVSFGLALKEFPEDAVAKIYLSKCGLYLIEGVLEGWEGIDVVDKGG